MSTINGINVYCNASKFHLRNRKVNDGAWGWRALRLLAKKTPHFFTYGNHPIAKLPDYLDSMIRKIVKEPSFQDSESAKQLLASMEVKPVAAASSSGSANTSAEESKGE